MLLLVLSKENLALAQAEAERLYGASGRREGCLLFLDASEYREGLAFTREIHELVATIPVRADVSPEMLTDTLSGVPYATFVHPPFLVRKRGDASLSEQELAGHVWRSLEGAGKTPEVDLKNPTSSVYFFFREHEVDVALLRWRNEERFFDRRPHLRPRNHPTSLSPKLARAMINLAGLPSSPASILDPFCGSGGILLEGCLAGRAMTGIDIDPGQIRRSEENLAHYGQHANLAVGDATACDQYGAFDAIVTDLPYGRNSVLKDAEATFTRFFGAAAKITGTMVVAADEAFRLAPGFSASWRETASFSWPLHKSMTKRIYLLAVSSRARSPP